ncbi:uncharacterized protein PG998_010062 [Apiospora kogelbergensis]|uniref:Uncharacterized protein n=1 Tax=Apiospora kogelbergensis TaxID=1337665 RepID=A0AAW0R9E0_9PEZI
MQQWPAFLEPLLDAAEDVTDPNLFNNVMVNTARLMREVQNLSVQKFQYLCEKLQAAEAEVKATQRNVTVNWRLLASTLPFDFRDFIDKLVRYSGMEPNMATNVVEALQYCHLETLHLGEPLNDFVPDIVKGLSYIDLVQINNFILK